MAPQPVIFKANAQFGPPGAPLGGTDRPVMAARDFRKALGGPSLHAGGDQGDMIDAATFHGRIAANVLEALAAKYLARTGHMLAADESIIVDSSLSLLEGRTHHP